MNHQAIERCGCGSLLLSAQEVRAAACEPCQAKQAHAARRWCRHDYLAAVCAECKAEAKEQGA